MFNRFREWFHHPAQSFLRFELDWVRRFLFRGPGLVWLFAYAALCAASAFITPRLLESVRNPMNAAGTYGWVLASYAVNGGSFFLSLALWISVLQRRTFRFLQKERFRDLYLTRATPRDLFPALMVAPVLVDGALKAIGGLSLYAVGIIGGSSAILGGLPEYTTSFIDERIVKAYELLWPLFPPVWWVYSLIYSAAITAFVASNSLPRGTLFSIVAMTMIGSFIVNLPGWIVMAIGMAAVFLGVMSVTITTTTSTAVATSNYSLPIMIFAVAPLLTMLTCFVVTASCLRRLRSEKTWNKLRSAAEVE